MSVQAAALPFEDVCERLRAFALAHPAERVSVSDTIVYGVGMDVGIAMAKLRAVADYARRECGIATLYLHNGPPDFREVPT